MQDVGEAEGAADGVVGAPLGAAVVGAKLGVADGVALGVVVGVVEPGALRGRNHRESALNNHSILALGSIGAADGVVLGVVVGVVEHGVLRERKRKFSSYKIQGTVLSMAGTERCPDPDRRCVCVITSKQQLTSTNSIVSGRESSPPAGDVELWPHGELRAAGDERRVRGIAGAHGIWAQGHSTQSFIQVGMHTAGAFLQVSRLKLGCVPVPHVSPDSE